MPTEVIVVDTSVWIFALRSSWTERASRAGVTLSIGDLLVGVLAADIGGLVWSLDSDFDRMEKLKLIERFVRS